VGKTKVPVVVVDKVAEPRGIDDGEMEADTVLFDV
jgi:hypothetical protein